MGKSCYARHGYLSGSDELRASDINLMFQDKEVDGIFCLRGGYGASRIIDRMLMQLILAGKLKEAKGFVLGNWKFCKDDLGKESMTAEEIFRELIAPLNKPTIYNLSAGHCKKMITLPLGVRVRLDADKRELVYLESVTKSY